MQDIRALQHQEMLLHGEKIEVNCSTNASLLTPYETQIPLLQRISLRKKPKEHKRSIGKLTWSKLSGVYQKCQIEMKAFLVSMANTKAYC